MELFTDARRKRMLAKWRRVARLAPLVGRFALYVGTLREQVYQPGGRGAKRARDHFSLVEAAAKIQASATSKSWIQVDQVSQLS